MRFKSKKKLFLFIFLTLLIGIFMYSRFSENSKTNGLYNPDLFSFKNITYKVSDAMPYIKYYQGLTGKNDEDSIRFGLDTYIKNEVLYSYIMDLEKTNSLNGESFSVSEKEIIDTIHKTPIFLVENPDTKEKEFSSKLYKDTLKEKGIETSFFEQQLRKELTLGKFLKKINELTVYNETSKKIALETTLNMRVLDTLKINYDLIPVNVTNDDIMRYYESNKQNLSHENMLTVKKYTFTHKSNDDKIEDTKLLEEELSKLSGLDISYFVNNKEYYKDNFDEQETNMTLSVTELTKLLNLDSVNIKGIPENTSFIDDTGALNGVIILYHVVKDEKGAQLSFDEAKSIIEPIVKKQKQEEKIYSQIDYFKAVDFSKINEPYLSYKRVLINPLKWEGDNDFLENSYKISKGEIALMNNKTSEELVKLVNIESLNLTDDEKDSFNFGQEESYKNSVLNLFYNQIKEIYNYHENNLQERIKDFK